MTEFKDDSAKPIQKSVARGYKFNDIKEKAELASNIPREILLQEAKNSNNVSRILLTISLNRSTLNVSQYHEKILVYFEDKQKNS